MLLELRIENLLLIERAELRFGAGLNVITGETGAGKTVLAHSLDLLMGGRARPQIVRPGAGEAWVEGVFELPNGLLDDPELAELADRLPASEPEIVLGRRVGASGRTSAFVAGRSASAADLRALASRLLAFYGQHEHRRLTLASAQLEILDAFVGPDQLALRDRYRAAHAQASSAARELEALRDREGTRERDLDLLRFELAEIEAARPDAAEEAELAVERERLRHAEALRVAAGSALATLAGSSHEAGDLGGAAETGAVTLLALAEEALGGAGGVDPALDALAERASAMAIEIGDLASAVREYAEGAGGEPGRLEAIEERLAVLDRLQRKHGGSIEAVLAHADRCRAEIERLASAEGMAGELEERLARAKADRAKLAEGLTAARRAAAPRLEQRVATELDELAMEGARLEVALEPQAGPDALGPDGAESVELRVATNPGMPVAPLKDAASGGELSRIMLALTTLGSREGGLPTLVFDEIDAGVGGDTARAVGERLRRLGEARQVVCITHLPRVASVASTHFKIEKHVGAGATRATVAQVGGDDLVAEIVRMLGAERGDRTATRHARELLKAA